jgi:PAS domain S-box-containing protein
VTCPTIRILHLEDNRYDADLAEAILAADGLNVCVRRVESKAAFIAALEAGTVDLILADFSLPQFDGLSAQRLAATAYPDLPFIFLSGTLGEEVAIERLKAGATDYVLKQRMARLPSSIRRALTEAEERRQRRRAEQALRELNVALEQRVREATAFLEDLIAASPSMVFRLDPVDLRITYASPNIGWILGYSLEEATSPGFWENVLHEDDREAVLTGLRHALTDSVVQIEQEYRLRSKDSRYRWFFGLTRVEYDSAGGPMTLLGYCLDISDRKAADEQVRAARVEAERANRAKSEFVSRMSHDLRTPLNAILGFAQLLASERLTAEQKESVELIRRGGEHLLDLINEVLDIARIEAGQLSLSPEPVDVADVVKSATELVAPLAARRSISIVTDPGQATGCAVLADRQRLNQVLLNMLSNAVKYNRYGGRVIVSFERVPPGRLRILVTDTGAGIPPEKLALLFTPFERLGAESTTIEGTGLGLAFSRSLAQAMRGSIGVSSEVDRGSTFWIELAETSRASLHVTADHDRLPPIAASAVTGNVLYIEDNTANVRLMERIVQRRRHVVLRHAATGELGLEAAARHRPDLIFLDLHLPDIPGEEVLRRLTEDPSLRHVPVAVLSADATPARTRQLKAGGAVTYVSKPLNVEKILRVLDEWLAEERIAQELP